MKYFRFTITPKGNEFMVSVRIDEFLNGDLDDMIDALNAADMAAKLSDSEE